MHISEITPEKKVNPNYIHHLTPKLQALCAQFPELKEGAKRVFTSYLRLLILMGNRKVLEVKLIDIDAFGSALHLDIAPKVLPGRINTVLKDRMRREMEHLWPFTTVYRLR
ncbi:unnamed protein product [Rotaria magnacalcarata]|uniref:ATP-dependent rRNA helicase SPB4-like C-terminal extension domain-containing protein n=2 Tax=Rotaria magnacalcarata TaxID=392030 RepID=A0A816ZN91_9BILA|nr:unnamed protein product [Rotaria magnacalcarata]